MSSSLVMLMVIVSYCVVNKQSHRTPMKSSVKQRVQLEKQQEHSLVTFCLKFDNL